MTALFIMRCSILTGKEAVDYIHSRLKFGSVLGFDRINALSDMLGNPQDKLKYVHVAGTNGKGSTSTMIAESLMDAGYKTGLFTSPYVLNFRERIQINGEMIPSDKLGFYVQRIKECIDILETKGLIPTEFEILTAVAFLYFYESGCDVAVLEVGMGGLFDSTNIIKETDVCVITSVSYDHTNILGNTIEEIAKNKAGIIKTNSNVAVYPQIYDSAKDVIYNKISEVKASLYNVDKEKIKIISCNTNGSEFYYKNSKIKTKLIGEHQIYNAATAFEAGLALIDKGYNITVQNIINGISKASIPARVQIISKNPLIVIDGGHNKDGVEALVSALKTSFSEYKITAVIGMMKDKDVDSAIKMIAPLCKKMFTVTVNNPRSASAVELKGKADVFCSDVVAVDDADTAFNLAKDTVKEGEMILVAGSLYLACEIIDKE